MSALTNDQRFVVLLIIGMVSGTWLSIGTTAQTFTSEDRGSILKFMDVLINFLDAESDNATSTESPIDNGTTTDGVESTTLSANATTVSSASESTTASNATESSTLSSESTEATSNSTTMATNATETNSTTESTSTTVTTVVPTLRRICFKRVCYKFKNDKGYIY